MKARTVHVVAGSLALIACLGSMAHAGAQKVSSRGRPARAAPASFETATADHGVGDEITERFTEYYSKEVMTHGVFMDVAQLSPTERRSVFLTLEALRYKRDGIARATKFNAICSYDDLEDQDTAYPARACSPMFRDSLSLGVGIGVEIEGEAETGVDAVASANLGALAGYGVSLGVEFPIQRRFKYPLGGLQAFRAPDRGGNILVESGVGSVMAGQAVTVQHGCSASATGSRSAPSRRSA